MAEPKLATRKAERHLKRTRIEKPVVPEKSQHQLAKSRPSVSFSPKDKGKRRETYQHTVNIPKSSPNELALPASFVVVAGSYEKLLYGLDGTVTSSESGYKFHLKPIFIFPAHVSSIKAVAASPHGGKWLASGSSDEIIKVWDLARRKEIGGLMHHQGMCSFEWRRKRFDMAWRLGSITSLQFPSRSHLLSASEDGTLCLFHARDWTVLRSLKGHKGHVNSVAIHPSGKVALSVGQDKTLRMWDLMRGKGSASTKLGKGEVVCVGDERCSKLAQRVKLYDGHCWDRCLLFSHCPHLMYLLRYAASASPCWCLITIQDLTLRHTITHPSRIHSLRFCKRVNGDGELLLVAAEDKKVSIYQVSEDPQFSPTIIAELVGHSNRFAGIYCAWNN